jgi:hypothetical protein
MVRDAHIARGRVISSGVRPILDRHDGQAVTCEDFVGHDMPGSGSAPVRNWYYRPEHPPHGARRRRGAPHPACEQSCPETSDRQINCLCDSAGHGSMRWEITAKAGRYYPDPASRDNTHTVLTINQPTQTFVLRSEHPCLHCCATPHPFVAL